MNTIHKILLVAFVVPLIYKSNAQELPDISYQDYGYTKSVQQADEIYYSIEYATDGSIKTVEAVEQITRKFNTDGNIESYENRSFLDESWIKSRSTYQKGQLHKEVWTHSNPYLNRTNTYVYNRQGKITEKKIRFKNGGNNHIKFHYNNHLLTQIEADIDGTESVTERLYSAQGTLYQEIHRQKVPKAADIVTHYYYLEGKEILSYVVTPQSHFYATTYLNDTMHNKAFEIKFKLKENSAVQAKLLKGITRFEQEAPKDNLPFNLQKYSEQTLQAHEKNKNDLEPYRIVMFIHDAHNNTIAEAEADVKKRNITSIGFCKTTFADGSSTGTTEFLSKKIHIFEALLSQLGLP